MTIYFYSPQTYTTDCNETGLPPGGIWTFNLHYDDVPGSHLFYNWTGTGNTPLMRVDSYSYVVTAPPLYGVSPRSGQFTVNGTTTVLLNFQFFVGEFNLAFSEYGLPNATAWSVLVGSGVNSSTTSLLVDHFNTGTYNYSVLPVPGYVASPQTGTATIPGKDATVFVVFTPFTYQVEITESGLPNGTQWSLTIHSTSRESSSESLSFQEPNGTYNYSLSGVPGFAPTAYLGEFVVYGGPVTQAVVWSPFLFSLRFSESGLPAGVQWSVSVDGGQIVAAAPGSINASLANGTHSFVVNSVSGYVLEPANGTVNISGSSAMVNVSFNATRVTSTGSPQVLILGVVAIVAVSAVAAAWLIVRRRGSKTQPPRG